VIRKALRKRLSQLNFVDHKKLFLVVMILPFLYIDTTSAMGKGVFTSANIEKNTLIEIAPVIVMSHEDRLHIDKTLLHDYIFEWGHHKTQCCMALGYIPLYNHSYQSNCEYEMDYDAHTISITTMRNINAGEELFINYNGNWNDATQLWFNAV
jgi:uncharacterized protein